MVASSLLLFSAMLYGQGSWVPPYKVLDKPQDVDLYTRRMDRTGKQVFLDGPLLTFICRSNADSVQLINMMEIKLQHIDGSNVWIAQATMDSWKGAFFSYCFVEGGLKRGMRIDLKTFRAPGSPSQPKKASHLIGKIQDYTIHSDALSEDRMVTVYLPPGMAKGIPAVYLTDGEGCRETAKYLEALIVSKKVRPIALIGVHSGGYRGEPGDYDEAKDFRAKEYLKMFDADRYALHLKFFCDEVVPWAEKKFGFSASRNDRAAQGFSNGAAFVTTASADRPEMFANAMAYSVAAFNTDALRKAVVGKKLPRMFFTCGELEIFSRGTKNAYGIVTGSKVPATLTTYKSGHDPAMWNLAFMKDVQTVFPPNKVPLGDEPFNWRGIG